MSTLQEKTVTLGKADNARNIALLKRTSKKDIKAPGIVWLGGFRSDMAGTKAIALDEWAKQQGRACLRLDYSGHGQSGGSFEEGTIGKWAEEAIEVFKKETEGPQIVVGSSMGGWIALLLAKHLQETGESDRLHALVLIAPAPDFTQELMWNHFSEDIRETLRTTGRYEQHTEYGPEPTVITMKLIEDGRNHLLLGKPLDVGCPVHILQGMQDVDVPHTHALRLVETLAGSDVVMTLVKDGDHRLSRPEDIRRLLKTVAEL